MAIANLFLLSFLLRLGDMLKSLIHLELNFSVGYKYKSILIFLHAAIQLIQHNLLKIPSFLNVVLLDSL